MYKICLGSSVLHAYINRECSFILHCVLHFTILLQVGAMGCILPHLPPPLWKDWGWCKKDMALSWGKSLRRIIYSEWPWSWICVTSLVSVPVLTFQCSTTCLLPCSFDSLGELRNNEEGNCLKRVLSALYLQQCKTCYHRCVRYSVLVIHTNIAVMPLLQSFPCRCELAAANVLWIPRQ